jgi:hypothetical protein
MHQYDDHQHIIIWQKWADPFGTDDDIVAAGGLLFNDRFDNEPEFENEEEGVDDQDIEPNIDHKKLRHIRVMATPMGIIPFTENTASSKIFNFWVGHSNFNITKKIASIIEETSGVETLDIFTRYRFRIAVGKAFKDSTVMQKINERVYTYLE